MWVSKKEIKLHLGCGDNIIDNWENLDIEKFHPKIKLYDLSKPLSYKSNSVSAIFSEHVIEHFDKITGISLLNECLRVLKPGGSIRIGWPDLKKLLDAHYSKNKKYFEHVQNHLPYKHSGDWDEFLSDCLFSWDHKYAYSAKTLQRLLKEIGFKDIKTKQFNESDYKIKFDVRNDPATTYLEAHK